MKNFKWELSSLLFSKLFVNGGFLFASSKGFDNNYLIRSTVLLDNSKFVYILSEFRLNRHALKGPIDPAFFPRNFML